MVLSKTRNLLYEKKMVLLTMKVGFWSLNALIIFTSIKNGFSKKLIMLSYNTEQNSTGNSV
jgi:hypothetical protein